MWLNTSFIHSTSLSLSLSLSPLFSCIFPQFLKRYFTVTLSSFFCSNRDIHWNSILCLLRFSSLIPLITSCKYKSRFCMVTNNSEGNETINWHLINREKLIAHTLLYTYLEIALKSWLEVTISNLNIMPFKSRFQCNF